jgi:hypothetical protein
MYDLVLQKEPENFDALLRKFFVLAKIKKYEQAIEY